jgi:hypothetical protein
MYKQNSYNKNQQDALISQIYFGIELYMFRTVHLVGFYYKNISPFTVLWMSKYKQTFARTFMNTSSCFILYIEIHVAYMQTGCCRSFRQQIKVLEVLL